MAKKVRRVKKKRRERSGSKETAVESKTSTNQPETAEEEFQLEYAYVLKDLRRVFILAAIMFTLLIALNLILQ